jgi:hypothetical protein
MNLFLEMLLFSRLLPDASEFIPFADHLPGGNDAARVTHAAGCEMSILLEVFRRISLLDGRHIPHYEADYDFSFRARCAGAAAMVNMPSLEEVREWYEAWKIKHGSAIHLNLDDGKSVSAALGTAYPNSQLHFTMAA